MEDGRLNDITEEQIAILTHTEYKAVGKRYCGGGTDMEALVDVGLMKSLGRMAFVPDEYFTITEKGRQLLFVIEFGKVMERKTRKN